MFSYKKQELLDICYECTGYGDDWHFNEEGELVSSCDECFVKKELDNIYAREEVEK